MRRRLPMLAICLFALLGRADSTPLTSVAEAKRLTDDACLTPLPFSFTGKVLNSSAHYWFFCDKTDGVEIHNRKPGAHDFTRGDTVRVRGEMTVEHNGARKFLADTVELLRTDAPDAPIDTTVPAILDGSVDFHVVRIRGVVSAVVPDEVDNSFCWATLRTPSGNVYLTLCDRWNDVTELQPTIDAEVVVTGLAAPTTGLRRSLGHRISVGKHDSIVIVRQPPEDPFSAPDLSDANLAHRQKSRGIVLATEPRRFFLKTAVGRIIPASPAPSALASMPVAGDLVTVVGFATDDPYRTQLTDALVRIDGHAAPPTDRPTPRPLQTLFVNEKGQERIESHVDGTVISVRGRVSTASPGELRVADGPYALSLDIPTFPHAPERLSEK